MKILFICSGNTCRSPMAQALFLRQIESMNLYPGADFTAQSAGIMACQGAPASTEAVAAMQAYGVDLSLHRARVLVPDLIHEADLILTMTTDQCSLLHRRFPQKRNSIYQITDFAGLGDGDIEDPFGKNVDVYHQAARQIQKAVEKIVDRLCKDKWLFEKPREES